MLISKLDFIACKSVLEANAYDKRSIAHLIYYDFSSLPAVQHSSIYWSQHGWSSICTHTL